jgi:glycosyltransferase involved in cell wall biosynthesis
MSVLIIPCYVKSSWDLACLNRLLDSIKGQRVPFEHIYLVDDASPLRPPVASDLVDLIRLPSNGGPARARNAGIERALASGAEHLLFTDHDCVLDPSWNEQMTKFLQTTSFGAVGGMTYSRGSTLLDYYHDINMDFALRSPGGRSLAWSNHSFLLGTQLAPSKAQA